MARRQRFHWLAEFAGRLTRHSSNHRARTHRTLSLRTLRSEPLEDRRLLSITVDTLVDEADGSIVDGDVSLRDAIALATPGETIDFAPELSGGTIELTLGELVIPDAVTIDATGLADRITIDAQENSRVIDITAATGDVTFAGLTLTGGKTTADGAHGGAIRSSTSGILTIELSTIIGNRTEGRTAGGGIFVTGDLKLDQTTVSDNSAVDGIGGGMYARHDITLIHSTVRNNTSVHDGGGGIFSVGDVTLDESTVSDNTTSGSEARGGGILARGDVTLVQSTVSGNSAGSDRGYGGGIYAANVTLTDSTVSGNKTAGLIAWGGGISSHYGVTLLRSTVTDNQVPAVVGTGGGIWSQNGPIAISGSIVAGNTAGGSGPDIHPGTGSVTANYSLIGTAVLPTSGTNNVVTDNPMLAPLADNGGPTQTHALLQGSPAFNMGDPGFVAPPDFDQRSAPFVRVAGGRVDIGAYEAQTLTLVVDTNADEVNGDYSTGDLSLREAVELANANPGTDQIGFAGALSGDTIALTHGELVVTDGVTIDATDSAGGMTIDAQQNSRVINVTATTGDVTFAGLTLTGGKTTADDADGGAIRSATVGILTIDRSTISGNSTHGSRADGGGIYAIGHVNLNQSTVSDNLVEGDRGGADMFGGGGVFAGGNVTLTESTVNNNGTAQTAAKGGGILAIGDITLIRSTASGNSTVGGPGGGFWCAGDVLLTQSTVADNHTLGDFADGGGFVAAGVTLVASTVQGNSTAGFHAEGGGIWAQSDITLVRSTVSGNSTTGGIAKGGGMYTFFGNVTLTQSTVQGNSTAGYSADGGGIWAQGDITVTQSAVSGNSTRGERANGGGLGARGNVTVIQSTVTDNRASDAFAVSGGIWNKNQPIVISGSIVAGNTAGGARPDVFSAIHSVTADYSLIGTTVLPTAGANNVVTDNPMLAPLADNGGPTQTHALLPGSPALDAGDPSFLPPPSFDQRGGPFVRVAGAAIDIGAYESQSLTLVVDTLVDESDGDYSVGDLSLREAIELANANPYYDTIGFDPSIYGGTILLTMGELPITDSVSINGPGADLLTIDASGNDPTPDENNGDGSRVFNIDDHDAFTVIDVEMHGLTLTGGDVDGDGGAVISFDTLRMSDMTVIDNAATSQGGGIWARTGLLGTTSITDTSIVRNHAGDLGGGIWASLNTTITRGQVTDNSAYRGGGIWTDGAEVDGTVIAQNSAASLGGGAWVLNTTVTDATIDANTSLSGGGGIVLDENASLNHSTVSNNTAGNMNTPAVANGAGVNIRGEGALVYQTVVTGNTAYGASSLGGGIWAGAMSVISNSRVAENSAAYGGGGIAVDPVFGGEISILNCNVTDNMTDRFGGGIDSRGGTVTITGTTISHNAATGGGGISTRGTTTITDSAVTDNSATSGGGILARGTTTVTNSAVTDNSATSRGGGIYVLGVSGDTVTVAYSAISHNSAVWGGGINAETEVGFTMHVVGSHVADNYASYRGGGIYFSLGDGGDVSIVGTTIAGNEATTGGGIWAARYDEGTTLIANSTISGNRANNGAGLYSHADPGYTIEMNQVTISGNIAEGNGGGAIVYGDALVMHSTITQNSGAIGGGWLQVGQSVHFDHSIIANNYGSLSISFGPDVTGLVGASISAQYSLIGDNSGTLFAEAPVGSPDANGNLIGDPNGQGVIDPLLGVLGDNGGPTPTHALTPGSPAIDAGDPNFLSPPDSDQRGAPFVRVFGGRIDMGAYERQSTSPLHLVVDTLVDERDGDYSPGDLSLREAIGLANGNIGPDTITFDPSLDRRTILLTLGELLIDDDVVIDGSSLTHHLTVDASGNDPTPDENNGDGSRVFNVDSGADQLDQITVSIDSLAVTGGDLAGTRYNGGGIYSRERITLEDVKLVDNAADWGGGGWLFGTSMVIDSQVIDNVATDSGGGLLLYSSSLIRGSAISGNTAVDRGGGIHVFGGDVTAIEYSTISDNTAQRGGGVSDAGDRTDIRNTTISGNDASDKGGGIYSRSDELVLEHVTITDNDAGTPDSGGVFNRKTGSRRTSVYSSIIAGNVNGDVGFIEGDVTNFESSGYNLIGTGNGAPAFGNNDQVGVIDPMLGPLQDNGGPTYTRAPLPGSPAIDAGDPNFTAPPDFDQRGAPFVRVSNGVIDVGSVEVQPFVVDTLVDEDDGDISSGDFSLREAVRLANQMVGPNVILFHPSLDGGTIDLTMGELLVKGSVDIDARSLAAGLTIDATASDPTPDDNNGDGIRIFNLQPTGYHEQAHVEIHGLTLTGGDSSDSGGAIRSTVNLVVTDSTITGNSSTHRGGGIYERVFGSPYAEALSVELVDNTIVENSAGDGGGIYIHVPQDSELTITGNRISRNTSSGDGGGLKVGSDDRSSILIADNSVIENSARRYGGIAASIGRDGELTITGNEISHNTSSDNGGGLKVGSGERSSILIADNSVIENSGDRGGGIYAGIGRDGELTITGNEISHNTSSNDGGGLKVRSDERNSILIADNSFVENSASRGGGIYAGVGRDDELTITGNEISHNTSSNDGGGLKIGPHDRSSILIADNSVVDNSAGRGGGIYAGIGRDGELTITGNEISHNTSSNDGGGLKVRSDERSSILIADNSVVENSGGRGGGIYVNTGLDSVARIIDNDISGNVAQGEGGGIKQESLSGRSTVIVHHNVFSENVAKGSGGGARFSSQKNLIFSENVVMDNVSSGSGGGIFINSTPDAVTTFRANAFYRNNAGADGGGLFASNNEDATTTINANTFAANHADAAGDGLRVTAPTGALVSIVNTTVSGNDGTGLRASVENTGRVEVLHSTITDGLYINDNGNALISHSIINGYSVSGPTLDPASGYNLIDTDAQLGPLADNGGPALPGGTPLLTQAPLPGSPAIDAGDPNFVPPPLADQRGYYRVADGDGDMTAQIDIGAVEYNSVAPLPGDGNLDGVVDGLDYIDWAMHFGDDPADALLGAPLNGDFNNDGVVDGLDYDVWATAYGGTLSSTTAQSTRTAAVDAAIGDGDALATSRTVDDLSADALGDRGVAVEASLQAWRTRLAFDAVMEQMGHRRK